MSKDSQIDQDKISDRRRFLKKLGYAAPVVLSLPALPAMASNGSSGNSDPIDPS